MGLLFIRKVNRLKTYILYASSVLIPLQMMHLEELQSRLQ
jgi:hypothetical protein